MVHGGAADVARRCVGGGGDSVGGIRVRVRDGGSCRTADDADMWVGTGTAKAKW